MSTGSDIGLWTLNEERGCVAVRCGQLRVDIRNYVLQYLFQRAETLQQFVTTALVQLLCRVTKLGWFDYDAHHEIVEDVSKFLTATPAHYLVRMTRPSAPLFAKSLVCAIPPCCVHDRACI